MIETLDYIVILAYLTGILILALYSGRLSSSSTDDIINDQYLAGKSLSVTESMASIIATEVSALTFLGIPAFSYGANYSFIQIYLGAIIGRIIIARIFLPKIYDKGLTIYSVMGKTGTINGQRFTAIFYTINKLLAVGVRLFSGSILVAAFFDISIYIAVSVICVVTFFYTLIGGLKAVVRTDMAQMGLFVLGGLIAHYIIPQTANTPWIDLISTAIEAGKMSILDNNSYSSLLIGIAGGVLFDMATHGVDQDFVQRLTANKSIEGAKKAIIWSTFLSIIVALIFLSIGSLLWSYYQTITPPQIGNDQLFAYFITNYFPTGLKGLMVAGVLAATMSTLDSSINAMSASFYKDIVRHDETKDVSKSYKMDTFLITLLLMIVAFVASKSDGLLVLGLKITSWTAGSLLALFFSSVIWNKFSKNRLDFLSVVGAYIVGCFFVYVNTVHIQGPWQMNVYFGFISSTIFLVIKGRFFDKANY